jgi:hypothetical protein
VKGAANIYTCTMCGGRTVTVDCDEGVTPFMIDCRASGEDGDCDGMAQSSFYHVPPGTPPPQWEWYAPGEEEIERATPGMRWHARQGGLFLRKLSYPLANTE